MPEYVAMKRLLTKERLKTSAFLMAKTGLSRKIMLSRDSVPGVFREMVNTQCDFPYPEDVQFEITMRCNLNCSMCHQKKRRMEKAGDLSYTDIQKIIDNFNTGGIRRVKLIGGEVFVREDITDIIAHLKERNIEVSITTNGTLLNDKLLDSLSKFDNIASMVFSIDGRETVHNKIRGSASAFSRTVTGLRKVSSFIPLTRVTCVLQKDNIGDIEEMITNCRQWGVDIMSFMLESFFQYEDLTATSELLRDMGDIQFLVSPSTTAGYGFSRDEFLDAVRKTRVLSAKTGVIAHIAPAAASLYPEMFYDGTIFSRKEELTCGYINRLTITEKGDVLACPFIDLNFGNLLHQHLSEIWNDVRFREYRSLFVSKGLFPICRRCCVLTRIKS